MNKSTFFTILTASLNNESTISKTLDSVKNQSFRDLEHIIIDGGSTDKTTAILKSFDHAYKFKWISERDHGISDALNKGLKQAKGRYILVIHADDHLLTPKTLEIIYPLLSSEKFDVHSFPVIKNSDDLGKVFYKPMRVLWWHHFKTIFPHQGCFVHRRVYDRVGGYRKEFSIALDYDFFYRVMSTCPSVKFEKRPVALMGGKGISNNQDFLIQRLREEVQVQDLNESNPFWRLAQLLFRTFYFPFKTRFLPKLQSNSKSYRRYR
jgi:glycosyltransferase involved in cell wall biosynthesis